MPVLDASSLSILQNWIQISVGKKPIENCFFFTAARAGRYYHVYDSLRMEELLSLWTHEPSKL